MKNLHEQYEGLVFDMDGTLADTMPTHFIAWTRTMEAQGLELSEERFWALGGVPAPVIIEMLAKEQGVAIADVDEVADEKERLFFELLADVEPVVPVYEIAKAHKDLMPMAIATGSPNWMAEKILGALGVRDWFGAIVAAEHVEIPKPAPDIYLKAAQLIGVDPKRCHAFEDAKLGIEAARKAGMVVVNIYDLLK